MQLTCRHAININIDCFLSTLTQNQEFEQRKRPILGNIKFYWSVSWLKFCYLFQIKPLFQNLGHFDCMSIYIAIETVNWRKFDFVEAGHLQDFFPAFQYIIIKAPCECYNLERLPN